MACLMVHDLAAYLAGVTEVRWAEWRETQRVVTTETWMAKRWADKREPMKVVMTAPSKVNQLVGETV